MPCVVFQGAIRYEVVGNYPAPTFFDVDPASGNVFVRQSLAFDSLLSTTYFVSLQRSITRVHCYTAVLSDIRSGQREDQNEQETNKTKLSKNEDWR